MSRSVQALLYRTRYVICNLRYFIQSLAMVICNLEVNIDIRKTSIKSLGFYLNSTYDIVFPWLIIINQISIGCSNLFYTLFIFVAQTLQQQQYACSICAHDSNTSRLNKNINCMKKRKHVHAFLCMILWMKHHKTL